MAIGGFVVSPNQGFATGGSGSSGFNIRDNQDIAGVGQLLTPRQIAAQNQTDGSVGALDNQCFQCLRR